MRNLALYERIADVEVVAANGGMALASVHPDQPDVGAIGAVEGNAGVIHEAERWLRARGCRRVRGPMEVATWFPYRASLGPATDAPFLGEPTASPQPWLAAGYREVARYASRIVPNEVALASRPSAPEGCSLRPMRDFDEAVATIHALSHRAFAHAYGFLPLPLDCLVELYRPLQRAIDPRLVLFAERDAQVVGFVLGMPDVLSPQSGRFIVKSLAVDPSVQRAGVGTWLVAQVHDVARQLGYREGVHALMWTGSASRKVSHRLGADGGRLLREYALYERELR